MFKFALSSQEASNTPTPTHTKLAWCVAVCLLAGCSSQPVSRSTKTSSTKTSSVSSHASAANQADEDSLETLLQATDINPVAFNDKEMRRYGNLWQRMRAGFMLDLAFDNDRIAAQQGWFITRQTYIDKLAARASYYLYYTVAEAQRRGIPSELALLPIIESSYDPTATSNAAAAGMWQFIPSTGRIYGLRQTASYDGRRDVIESTRAAYDFLTSLYNKFGSWELALAAYNAGPGRVQNAINANAQAGYATDYWSLSLPKETMNYVPRFLAVAKIVNNPRRYGVNLPKIANRPFFRSVPIQGGVSLASVSQMTGLDMDTLYDLNPALLQGYTDLQGPNRILVPVTLSKRFDESIVKMAGQGFYQNPSASPVVVSNANSGINNSGITPSGMATTNFENYAAVKQNQQQISQPNQAATVQDSAANRRAFYAKKSKRLPKSASALAEFAASARVPNQTFAYIPVKSAVKTVTTTVPSASNMVANNHTNTKPASKKTLQNVKNSEYQKAKTAFKTDTAAASSSKNTAKADVAKTNIKASTSTKTVVTETEKQKLQAQVLSEINALPTSAATVTERETVVAFPALSKQERQQIVAEMQQNDPSIDVIDPLDGEIKLEAIQTQQSILAAQGKKKQIIYTPAPANKSTKRSSKSKPKPTGKRTVYKVKAGDSLKKIGERYGLYWRDIAQWNQINPHASLYVGTPLYLYGAKTVAASAKPKTKPQTKPKPTSYRVQAGDTMIGVAAKFGMSASELAKLNGMKALDDLIIGQRLTLIANGKSNASKQVKKTKKPQYYQVKAGEGLIQLAKRFGVSTQALAQLNNMSPTKNLYVGQRLKIPANARLTQHNKKTTKKSAKKPTSYRVRAGDTMIGVAAKFEMSASELAKLNGMKTLDNLIIGQRLTLVAKGSTSKKQAKRSTKSTAKASSYVVESGDTMIYVARKFGLSINQLAKLNGMKPFGALRIGQRLTLVEKGKAKSTKSKSAKAKKAKRSKKSVHTKYKVKRGDSLIALARKHGISTKALAKLNGIKPTDSLKRGQTIKVPSK